MTPYPLEMCKALEKAPKWVAGNAVLLVNSGSHAYGMATPTSDHDYKGITIPPKEFYFGFLQKFEQFETHEPCDLTVYGLQKYMSLAADCNPNILELVWSDPSDYFYISSIGRELIEMRDMFLSQKARHTYSGYSFAQIKRMKTHRNWLLNPPSHKPTREEYGLPDDRRLMSKDEMGALEAVSNAGNYSLIPESTMAVYSKERSYSNAMRGWDQYENWRKTRNPARAAIEAKYGYDAKHGAHVVRLMRQCKEILLEGKVRVRRPDAEELLAIRNGAWPYEKLVEWADEQEKLTEEWAAQSKLPHGPDRAAIDKRCQNMIERFLYGY